MATDYTDTAWEQAMLEEMYAHNQKVVLGLFDEVSSQAQIAKKMIELAQNLNKEGKRKESQQLLKLVKELLSNNERLNDIANEFDGIIRDLS